MSGRFLTDRFVEAKEEALVALRRGERGEARRKLLEAAACLYRLASLAADPQSRRERLEAAEGVKRLAEKISPGAGEAQAEAQAGAAAGPFIPVSRPEVRLSDVAGLTEAKEELELRLILPQRHPEKAARFGVEPGGGVLLYGPPGTGKTLLARAVAGEVQAPFFTVRPSEILSKWVGDAEKNVARLFKEARSYPLSVIFIDEIDSLVPQRARDGSSVMTRLVPQILNELEGFHRSGGKLLFLGATNEPWALDPAILRPGRFDARIYVGLPDGEAREEILRIHLAGRPLAGDVQLVEFAESLEGRSGADLREICRKAASRAFRRSIESGVEEAITMEDLAQAARSVPPSVTEAQLKRYEAWRRKWDRGGLQ